MSHKESVARLIPAAGWAVVVGAVGGFGCGLAIHRYGSTGCLALWLLGG